MRHHESLDRVGGDNKQTIDLKFNSLEKLIDDYIKKTSVMTEKDWWNLGTNVVTGVATGTIQGLTLKGINKIYKTANKGISKFIPKDKGIKKGMTEEHRTKLLKDNKQHNQ